MRGLDYILGNRGRLMVLRVLWQAQEPLSGRQIQRASGLANRAVMNALHNLVTLCAVQVTISSRMHQYRLNANNYLVRNAIIPAFDAELHFWEDVARTIRRTIRPRPIAAVATGPLARDDSQYGGRLMLTMLFATGRNRLRALASIGALTDVIAERYALTLEHQMLDVKTMDREEYSPLWRRVEREGILLFGALP